MLPCSISRWSDIVTPCFYWIFKSRIVYWTQSVTFYHQNIEHFLSVCLQSSKCYPIAFSLQGNGKYTILWHQNDRHDEIYHPVNFHQEILRTVTSIAENRKFHKTVSVKLYSLNEHCHIQNFCSILICAVKQQVKPKVQSSFQVTITFWYHMCTTE